MHLHARAEILTPLDEKTLAYFSEPREYAQKKEISKNSPATECVGYHSKTQNDIVTSY